MCIKRERLRKGLSVIICLAGLYTGTAQTETIVGAKGELFKKRIVASALSDPWEIVYGPDNQLWVTESRGYRVSKIDPATGTKKLLIDLNNQKNFWKSKSDDGENKPWPQGGLMGMALHPQLYNGKPYVYLSYVYKFIEQKGSPRGCGENFGGCFFTARIVRYTYDLVLDTLIRPEIMCDTLPASSDHNGGRMLFAAMNGKEYVFYAIGEMGAGQAENAGRKNHAQEIDYYRGKILRFNAEPDEDTNLYDKWLPNDNPFNAARQNAVYSLGHRNPQGLTIASSTIYAVEHGPFSDDELNRIEKGKNYGHPLIEGDDDGNYNGLAAAATGHETLPGPWRTTLPTIVDEHASAIAIGPAYRNPIKSFYPTPRSTLVPIVTKAREGGRAGWVSEAPSSVDSYTAATIPGWKNSLLVSTLKTGKVLRLPLKTDGSSITGDTIGYFKAEARYRDIAISADGKNIYLAIDSSHKYSGPNTDDNKKIDCGGCIVEFSYQAGDKDSPSKNPKPILQRKVPTDNNTPRSN